MKKYVLLFSILLILSASSVFAESCCFRLGAYSLEKVTLERRGVSLVIKTNSKCLNYGFYDSFGNLTNAEDATILSIVSA
jgi:hypothetical protein